MREYFSRLNPTLTELTFRSILSEDCLQVLDNIRIFRFHAEKPNHVFRDFLRTNAKHLECIEVLPKTHGEDRNNAYGFGLLEFEVDTDQNRAVQRFGYLTIMQEIPQLKSLTFARKIKGEFEHYYEEGEEQDGPGLSLLVPFFTEVGPRLKELVLRVRGKGFRTIINGQLLSQLETLHLISSSRVIWEEDLQDLCGIQTMRKFTFQAQNYMEDTPMSFRKILRLIEAWPHLVEMTIYDFGLDLRTSERLSEYLRNNNRKLTINNSEY